MEPKKHYLELGIEFCLELAIGLYQLGAEQMDLPHNFWVGLVLWIAATAVALRMLWIFPGIERLNPKLKVAIASVAVALLVFITRTPVTSAYKKAKAHDLSAHEMPVHHQQDSKPTDPKPEEKTSQQKGESAKKTTPKPKTEQPNIRVGPIEQGPCSNAQIGGSNNQATTNCTVNPDVNPYAPVVTYTYHGVRHITQGVQRSTDDALSLIWDQLSASLNRGDFKTVITIADRQIAENPGWLAPYVFSSNAYAKLCNKEKAIKQLEHVEMAVNKGQYELKDKPVYDSALSYLSQLRNGNPEGCP